MLKQIRYFQAVLQCGSFSEAASQCYISQSAISQQIKGLEHELGFELFVRHNRRFSLTPAGSFFYKKSLILTADFERMTTQALHIAHGSSAQVRVGFLISYSGNELSSAIAEFSKFHPEIELHTEFGTHEELFNSLRAGHCDLVLNDQRRAFSDEYVNHSFASFQAFIAVSKDCPLSQRAGICMNELKQHSCILICSKAQSHIEEQFYRSVLNVEGDFLRASSISEGMMMVLSKQGFMILDGCMLRQNSDPSIAYVPLIYEDGRAVMRNYCLFMRRDNDNENAKLLLKSLASRLG